MLKIIAYFLTGFLTLQFVFSKKVLRIIYDNVFNKNLDIIKTFEYSCKIVDFFCKSFLLSLSYIINLKYTIEKVIKIPVLREQTYSFREIPLLFPLLQK